MNTLLYEYKVNKSVSKDISAHLTNVDGLFFPRLSSYVEISVYSEKLAKLSDRIEIWSEEKLVGLLAYYLSKEKIYISNVSLETNFQGIGLGKAMFKHLFKVARCVGCTRIELRVNFKNVNATKLYFCLGFHVEIQTKDELLLVYYLGNE